MPNAIRSQLRVAVEVVVDDRLLDPVKPEIVDYVAALQGFAIIAVLAGVALLGSSLVLLQQDTASALLLLAAAALIGLSAREKSALAVQH